MYSKKDVLKISECTKQFYSEVAESFSATRQKPWDGWVVSFPHVKNHFDSIEYVPTILDIGCGNLRYENFLQDKFPDRIINCDAVDSCPDLSSLIKLKNINLKFIEMDIVETLLSNNNNPLIKQKYDLIVTFGLLHHIPSSKLRLKFLKSCISALKSNGLLIVSFWQFYRDKRLINKATDITKMAKDKLNLSSLEEDDYFLNWQHREDVFRFCHNFSEDEIFNLKQKLDAHVCSEFNSDGSSGDLNKYLILKALS